MEIKTLRVEGLSCVDCAARVRAAVGKVEGVDECSVDYATGTLKVVLTDDEMPVAQIAKAVSSAGYKLADLDEGEQEPEEEFAQRDMVRMGVAALFTLIGLGLAAAGLFLDLPSPLLRAKTLSFAAAIFIGGYPVARHAYQEAALAHRVGINLLMVIAVSGAMLIGEWAEAAVVVVLFALGEALEEFAAERARRALDRLLDLAPPTALRLTADGTTESVPVQEIDVGDRVLVRPGDRVSVDGIVLAGESAIDQSPITGESIPVEKKPGDPVFAGTINTSGALEVEVTQRAEDNTLSRMVRLVQEAQSRQAPVQRFIDRFARVYTPAVAVIALLVAALPPLLFGQPFWGEHGWLMRALQLLVIACPCALVISTPVSLVSALTNAASRGVLIKGGRYLEALSRVRAFAFDKTGTLTEGRPIVTDVLRVGSCPNVNECGLLYAAALESQSSHPLARAVVAEAEARQIDIPRAEGVNQIGGRGIEGAVNGVKVTVASHAHFDEHIPHTPEVCKLARDLGNQGKTTILVHHDDEVCTLLGVADAPRESSKQAIATLKSETGVETVMLTGDHPAVAQEIARKVGIDRVHAGLLPEEKVAMIADLSTQYGSVAMVGDGVNDAPALAQADVGIAMGGAGSAQAMETADVVLMGDDLSQLPFIVRLSHRTRRTIMANITLALAVKAVVFILALAGLATLWMAIAADVGASVVVILNGMRLRRYA